MDKNRLIVVELFLIAATMVLVILWIRNPQGNYEPWTLFGTILWTFLEIVRQSIKIQEKKIAKETGVSEVQHLLNENRDVMKSGMFRYILDQYLPRIHTWLTIRVGLFEQPPEWFVLNNYLRILHSTIADDIREKTYVEPNAKKLPESANRFKLKRSGFLTPIQQLIKEIVGVSHGGDLQNAQISAISKKSKFIRNIARRLLKADKPLILLGDPGTGKSITLQQAAMLIAEKESKRIFPRVCLFIRLGEFQVSGAVNTQTVWDYVKKSMPKEIRPYLESLEASERLVIFFDGMDEMSRERYNEHTTALSIFAGSKKERTKTFFSCRITDFTPRFQHNRLVLLPFSRTHIYRYLKRQIPSFPIKVGGRSWSARQLGKRLSQGGLPMQADNPFVLWLLCCYLQEEQDWPKSRVHLLEYYNRFNYERKIRDASGTDESIPNINRAFLTWGRIAYEITDRNKGVAIPLKNVKHFLASEELPAVQAGIHCGVLQESLDLKTILIRFEHHRFQEFFTAFYLNENRESKSTLWWLDKLDAPRWQETLFNLVLMDGGQEALIALNEAVKKDLVRLKMFEAAGKTLEAAQVETLLADRVELASRVLQQTHQQSDKALDSLFTTFRDAAYWLSDYGNPITKVKMLVASKIVPGIDIFRVARKPLTSDVSWVRQQALVISSVASGKVGIDALQEDMLHSFASGRFLNRFASYFRIASALKKKRFWNLLFIGLSLYLLQFLVGYGLVATTRNIVTPTFFAFEAGRYRSVKLLLTRMENDAVRSKDEKKLANLKKNQKLQATFHAQCEAVASTAQKLMDSRWFSIIVPGSMLIALLYTLPRAPGLYFFIFQCVGYILILIPFIWLPLWLGYWFPLLGAILFLPFIVLILCTVNWSVTLLIHLLILQLFIAASSSYWTNPLRKKRMLWEAMWENFSRVWSKGLVCGLFIFCSLFILILFRYDVWGLIKDPLSLFPFFPIAVNVALSITIYAEIIGGVVCLLSRRKRSQYEQGRRMKLFLSWTRVCIVSFISVFLLWGLFLAKWEVIWQFIVAVFDFLPFLPRAVNFALSVIIYAEIIGSVVTLLSRRKRSSCGWKQRLKRLLIWMIVCLVLSIIVLLIWGLTLLNWKVIREFIEFIVATIGLLPFFPPVVNSTISLAIYIEIIGGVICLVSKLRRLDYAQRRRLKVFRRWTLVSLALVILTFIGWGFYAISEYLARILSFILLLAFAVTIIIILWRLLRDATSLLVILRGRKRHATYSSETWKNEFQKLNSDFQSTQLRQTTPETLDLSISDFLALLQEIEQYVKKEDPAQSAYWAKRYEIEQIIRQEKIG